MLWTSFLIPTTKETPSDVTAASHALMLRSGMIRQVAAGSYAYLPLGLRTLRKVEAIVRAEMNRIGSIELAMPALHPRELWQKSGRVEAMGDVLLGIDDKGTGDWRSRVVLGPTHEEVITEIAAAYITSYKQLPVTLYQIQTKFRGEARPKSGVLRTREFLMKDAYSFHRDLPSLDRTYRDMHRAYSRIFSRCGLPFLAVEADSGAIGGDSSHEFMVPTDAGEDLIAVGGDLAAGQVSYAANTERAEYWVDMSKGLDVALLNDSCEVPSSLMSAPGLDEVHTPDCPGIYDVCVRLGVSAERMIKTLVYEIGREGRQTGYILVLLRGDHEVNEVRLKKLFPGATLELANPAKAAAHGFAIGYVGPHAINGRRDTDVRVGLVIDPQIPQTDAVTGANRVDYHVRGFCLRRDVDINLLARAKVASVRLVQDGDLSPVANGDGSHDVLHLHKAIEIGHIFKLGTKYSTSLKAQIQDEDKQSKPMIMGCYGIGVNRIIASAVEAMHDEKGIIWPVAIAPFSVCIVNLDVKADDVTAVARSLHDALEAAGIDVILDDRDERAGFKFNDADLIGFPIRVTVGRKGLKDGMVELKLRRESDIRMLPVALAAQEITSVWQGLCAELETRADAVRPLP